MTPLVCPHCRAALDETLACAVCGRVYLRVDGIADFAEGQYYDRFDPSDALPQQHLDGLELEREGSLRRIRDFYAPLIRRFAPHARRVLDCGCGNGVSVERLNQEGFDAWGNDLSQLRKWQWRNSEQRDKLVVADALRLPFPDCYFDVVISSGVVEHIGVQETGVPRYAVVPNADRDEKRAMFLRELARVTAANGQIFIDCPNGAFPIDFWHGDSPGSARFHSTSEGFLPRFSELRSLSSEAIPGARVTAHSPRGRLQFKQSSRHWYGRILQFPAELLFIAMSVSSLLARSALNPFLVVRIAKGGIVSTSQCG